MGWSWPFAWAATVERERSEKEVNAKVSKFWAKTTLVTALLGAGVAVAALLYARWQRNNFRRRARAYQEVHGLSPQRSLPWVHHFTWAEKRTYMEASVGALETEDLRVVQQAMRPRLDRDESAFNIGAVKRIFNEISYQRFEGFITQRQLVRKTHPHANPQQPDQEAEATLEHLIQRTQSYPGHDLIRVVWVWHATNLVDAVQGICSAGVIPFHRPPVFPGGPADYGFFGRGSYFTFQPEYASQFGQHFILGLAAFSSARCVSRTTDYPAATPDDPDPMSSFHTPPFGAAIPTGFDAVYARVRDGKNAQVPRPGEFERYEELVLSQESQFLPLYLVQMVPKTSPAGDLGW